MHPPLITLLTDFGLTDVYVGVMKGVIARIYPALTVVDLTHAIPPQNIALASFQLGNAYSYFPADTIHVVVVDPGVGGQRRAIACRTAAGLFIAPDNGVLTAVLAQTPPLTVVELTHPAYWRTASPSTTFHGRDIFAPVAAHVATGIALTAVGRGVDPETLIRLPQPTAQATSEGWMGVIQAIDHFGNLITNIPAQAVPVRWRVHLNEQDIPGGTTYSDAPPGEAISLIGSHGWLEIAVNGGSAQMMFQGQVCDRVVLITS